MPNAAATNSAFSRDGEVGVEAEALGDVAEPATGSATGRRAEERDRAAARAEQAEEHADERRLPRAVSPDEADDLTATHREGDAVNGDEGAEARGDVDRGRELRHGVLARSRAPSIAAITTSSRSGVTGWSPGSGPSGRRSWNVRPRRHASWEGFVVATMVPAP